MSASNHPTSMILRWAAPWTRFDLVASYWVAGRDWYDALLP